MIEKAAARVTLSWVVVAHDSARDLARLLPALSEQLSVLRRSGLATELLVVDNASRDDIERVVHEAAPGARLLHNVRNLGFGPAANRAAAQARGAWIVFSNADLVVPAEGLAALPEVLAQAPADVALLGPAVIGPGGSRDWSCGRFPGLARLLVRLVRTPVVRARRPRPVDWISGACLMVRREVFDAHGGFDERFFLYYEDVDLARRLRASGHRALLDPRLSVVHHRPLHRRSRDDGRLEAIVRASRLAYFRKHRPAWEARALRVLGRGEALVRGRHSGEAAPRPSLGTPATERR